VNARCTPAEVGGTHSSNQFPHVQRDWRSTLRSATLPGPVKAESLCDAMRLPSQVSRCEVLISSPSTRGRAKPRGDDRRPTAAGAASGFCAGVREVDGARQGLLPGGQLVYGTSHAGWRAGKPKPASSPRSLSRPRVKCNRSATTECLVGTDDLLRQIQFTDSLFDLAA